MISLQNQLARYWPAGCDPVGLFVKLAQFKWLWAPGLRLRMRQEGTALRGGQQGSGDSEAPGAPVAVLVDIQLSGISLPLHLMLLALALLLTLLTGEFTTLDPRLSVWHKPVLWLLPLLLLLSWLSLYSLLCRRLERVLVFFVGADQLPALKDVRRELLSGRDRLVCFFVKSNTELAMIRETVSAWTSWRYLTAQDLIDARNAVASISDGGSAPTGRWRDSWFCSWSQRIARLSRQYRRGGGLFGPRPPSSCDETTLWRLVRLVLRDYFGSSTGNGSAVFHEKTYRGAITLYAPQLQCYLLLVAIVYVTTHTNGFGYPWLAGFDFYLLLGLCWLLSAFRLRGRQHRKLALWEKIESEPVRDALVVQLFTEEAKVETRLGDDSHVFKGWPGTPSPWREVSSEMFNQRLRDFGMRSEKFFHLFGLGLFAIYLTLVSIFLAVRGVAV